MSKSTSIASRIVARIENDITDRGGIGSEWEQIDDDIREGEIIPEWIKIINEEVEPLQKKIKSLEDQIAADYWPQA